MNRLPLAALFGANAISLTGDVLTLIAVPWFVLQTTGSAAKTGLSAFSAALAVVVAGFLGGGVVDRLGYKRASIVAALASGAAVALVPLLYSAAGLAFWQLLALVFVANLFDAPGATARTDLVPEVARAAGMSLERATASVQAVGRGARLLGAPLAGVLIAALGPSRVLLVDAATFAASALLIGVAVPAAPPPTLPGTAEGAGGQRRRGYLADLLDGLRVIARDRLIRAIVLTTNFLDAPLFSVVMPVYARRAFGSALDLGLMAAGDGAGALLGAALFGLVGPRLPRRVGFIGAFVLVGLPFWALAALPPLPVALTALFVTGLAAGPINPIIYTVAYERIPDAARGRVLGTLTAGAFVAIPLGVPLTGYALQGLGIRATVAGIAACYLVVTLSLLVNPAIEEMRPRGQR